MESREPESISEGNPSSGAASDLGSLAAPPSSRASGVRPVPPIPDSDAPGPGVNAIEVRGVGKRFGATWVLRDIDLDIRRGTIHALIGQNGAGKSTLGKIIGGVHSADSGELRVFGETVGRWDPRRALAKGVAVIQQELSLVPELSVAQNVVLGVEEHRAWYLRPGLDRRLREFASAAASTWTPRSRSAAFG